MTWKRRCWSKPAFHRWRCYRNSPLMQSDFLIDLAVVQASLTFLNCCFDQKFLSSPSWYLCFAFTCKHLSSMLMASSVAYQTSCGLNRQNQRFLSLLHRSQKRIHGKKWRCNQQFMLFKADDRRWKTGESRENFSWNLPKKLFSFAGEFWLIAKTVRADFLLTTRGRSIAL